MTPIHDEGALEGLADVPWAELKHAYGPAEDVPGLLRAIASGDEQAGKDAVYELFGNIWHQGSVYEATPHAVPFLARLAAAGMAAEGVLHLLGSIAQSADERGGAVPGAARNVVLAQADVLLPLIRHESSAVRALTAWTLAMCRAGDAAFAAVHARWVAEEGNAVRCTLLKAMSELDPTRARPIVEGVAVSGATATERLVAAWACVTTGVPWSDDLRAAALAWLAAGLDLENGWWGDGNEGPFGNLLRSLAGRGDLSVAAALAIDALALAVAHETFTTALWDVEQFADQYRVPVPELAAVLAGQVTDPKNGKPAVSLLQRLPPVPGLADLMYTAADVRRPGEHADQALSYLIELGDPRAASLLAADLVHRPGALQRAAEKSVPFHPDLLDAIRAVLRSGNFLTGRQVLPTEAPEGMLRYNGLISVLRLLAAWGPPAVAATPELTGLLATLPFSAVLHFHAGRALAAIAGPVPAALQALHQVARTDADWPGSRLKAARELGALTGDDEPLLAVIRETLAAGRRDAADAAEAVVILQDPPGWLIPLLEERLAATSGQTRPDVSARLALELALWHLTGDPTRVLTATAAALHPDPVSAWPFSQLRAAKAALALGPAAGPLTEDLLPTVSDPVLGPTSAQAILRAAADRAENAGFPALADRLVTALRADGRRYADTLDVLREIHARVPGAISPELLSRLRRLADGPDRVIKSGLYDTFIREDEALRIAIREFLDEVG